MKKNKNQKQTTTRTTWIVPEKETDTEQIFN